MIGMLKLSALVSVIAVEEFAAGRQSDRERRLPLFRGP